MNINSCSLGAMPCGIQISLNPLIQSEW